MSVLVGQCQYFNCQSRDRVQLYCIVDDLYLRLCIGHAELLVSTRKSTVALIEFLVDCYGGKDPKYRATMRAFIAEEAKKVIDGG